MLCDCAARNVVLRPVSSSADVSSAVFFPGGNRDGNWSVLERVGSRLQWGGNDLQRNTVFVSTAGELSPVRPAL